MNIRSFIPPIFFSIRSKQPMKKYESYQDGLDDSNTYEDSGVIQVVLSKTEVYRNAVLSGSGRTVSSRQTAQNMFVLDYVFDGKPIEVLEIGGACGASYFELNHLLPGKISQWNVVETPAMVAAASAGFGTEDRLNFYGSLQKAVVALQNRNLLIAQGVLQYIDDPIDALKSCLNLRFKYVYITRTVVGENIDRPIITNKDRLCERSEPRSYPVVGQARHMERDLNISKYLFLNVRRWKSGLNECFF